MNTAQIIGGAAKEGILLSVLPTGNISAKGEQSAIDRWLPAIRQNKAGIVLLLRSGANGWSEEDWQAFYGARAGIAEFDRGFSRADADLIAFEDCVDHWIFKNPPAVETHNFCTLCGLAADYGDASNICIAGGAGVAGILHGKCAPKWFNQTRWQARRALMWLYQKPR